MRFLTKRFIACSLVVAVVGDSYAFAPQERSRLASRPAFTTQALTPSMLCATTPVNPHVGATLDLQTAIAGGYPVEPISRRQLPMIAGAGLLATLDLFGQRTPARPSATLSSLERSALESWIEQTLPTNGAYIDNLSNQFNPLDPPYAVAAIPYLTHVLTGRKTKAFDPYKQFNAGRALVGLIVSGNPDAIEALARALATAPIDVVDALTVWLNQFLLIRLFDPRPFEAYENLVRIFLPYQEHANQRWESIEAGNGDLVWAARGILKILGVKEAEAISPWNTFNGAAIISCLLVILSLWHLHRKKHAQMKTDDLLNDYLPTIVTFIILIFSDVIHSLPFFRANTEPTSQHAYLPAYAAALFLGLYIGLLFMETLQAKLQKALYKANTRKIISRGTEGNPILHDSWIPDWAINILATLINTLPAILILGSYSLTGTDLFSRVGMLLSVLLGILAIQMIANETIGQLFVWQENNRLSKPARTTLLGIAVSAISAYAIFSVPDWALAAQYFTFVVLLVFATVSPWALIGIVVFAAHRWFTDRKNAKMNRALNLGSA